jgi:hypothetical protein
MKIKPDLRSQLDHLRQSFVPFYGQGAGAFYPVRLRPCLGFALVPRRRSETSLGEGRRDAVARKKERIAAALGSLGGGAAGLVDGAYSDASGLAPSLPKGMGGLTRHGAGEVEQFCRLVRQDKGLYAMWTVTLPPSAAEALDTVDRGFARFQSVIRRRFSEALARACRRERGKVPCLPHWCFVVEPQKSGRPHIHFVFRCRSRMGRPWLLSTQALDRLIQGAISVAAGIFVPVPAAGNVAAIRADPGRYLSSYLKKGVGGTAAETVLLGGWSVNLVPSQWWGLSVSARHFLARYSFEIPGGLVGWLSLMWPGLRGAGLIDGMIWQAPGRGAPSVVCGGWRDADRCRRVVEYLADLERDAIGSASTFGFT